MYKSFEAVRSSRSRGVIASGESCALSRRALLAGAGASMLPLAGCTWFEAPPPVIGYLEPISGDSSTNRMNLAAFRKGLGEQGFFEDDNVTIEYRYADGDMDRLNGLAKDLVERQVAVLVASSPSACRAAKALTTTIPIVFGQAADAVENSEVTNLEHPEANLTGVANHNELGGKRLDFVSAMTPPSAKIVYLSDPNLASFDRNLRETTEEADRLGRRLVVMKASKETELLEAFARISMPRSDIGGLCVGPIRGAYSRPGRLVGLAAHHPLPTIYYDRAFVDAGGLMSYGASFREIFHMVGVYAGRILNGAKPGDLPVLRPTDFELVVNLKTANAQGLTVPPSILAQASEVLA